MHITYRPLAPDIDIPRMAEIWNAHIPGTTSAEALARNEARYPKEWPLHRTAAVDETDRLLGWSVAQNVPMLGPERWQVRVTVDPRQQRQGIGTRLYDEARRFAVEHGATRLDATVPDSLPPGLGFAEARGFRVDRHLFPSVLDLERFDEAAFASHCEVEGIRIASLAELGETPETRRQLWALEMQLNADVPGFASQGFAVPYEEYCELLFQQPWYQPDLQLLALEGDSWVGMASLRLGEAAGRPYIYHNMTGVVATHRGRHIGLALKLAAVRCAQRHGAGELRTDNDSENAPMVALNRKLGFQPRPGEYRLINALR
jgi:GNAT superfamily N-acetyltransferase